MPALLLSLCCLLLYCTPAYCSPTSSSAKIQPLQNSCTVEPARHQILLTGFTRARSILDITGEVSGRCLTVSADTGETIAPDGIFAVIDSTLVKLDLKANSVKQQQLKRTLRFESRQVKRFQQLHSSKSSSQVQLDQQELKRDQSRLKLDQLQIEAEHLQELLARHRVKAPAGWRIINRHIEPGQWVAAGTVLAGAGDYRSLIVPLAVTPSELHTLRQQKSIALYLPDDDLHGSGSLYRVSPGFDPRTRKIQVEILLDRQTYDRLSLKQGGIRVNIPVNTVDPMHGFLVPAEAVTTRYEEHWLTRLDGSQVRVVVLGRDAGFDDSPDRLHITSDEIRVGDIFSLPRSPRNTQ